MDSYSYTNTFKKSSSGSKTMTYLIEFPLHTGEMQLLEKTQFGTITEAEDFIRDLSNKWLTHHGIVNIVKVEKTIVHRVDIRNE